MLTEEDLAEVATMRAEMASEARAEARAELGPRLARVADIDAAGVPCRLYEPTITHGLMLYFHGGGFVYGDLDTHDVHCRRMAAQTGWTVLAVHYRRAPEDRFPAAVEDAETVAQWLASGPLELGVPTQLAVSGDSAGANLALGVALRHRDLFSAQVLVYPFLDPSCASYDTTIKEPDFDIEALAWFWKLYVDQPDRSDVRLDPLAAPDFKGMPRTLVQFGALDVLTTPGEQLVERLRADEVEVDSITYPGVGHGFWRHDDNDQHPLALADLADFLADRAARAPMSEPR